LTQIQMRPFPFLKPVTRDQKRPIYGMSHPPRTGRIGRIR
jgi:hypothetical protein